MLAKASIQNTLKLQDSSLRWNDANPMLFTFYDFVKFGKMRTVGPSLFYGSGIRPMNDSCISCLEWPMDSSKWQVSGIGDDTLVEFAL